MIVNILNEVFLNKSSFGELDKIIELFYQGRHSWHITDPNFIENSVWLKSEGNSRFATRVDFLMKSTVHSIYTSKDQFRKKPLLCISITGNGNGERSITDACVILSQPLFLIVENENSDRVFIEMIAKAFNYKEIFDAIAKGWIHFDSEGGNGAIPRKLDAHMGQSPRLRVCVLVDSDRECHTDEHKVKEIEAKCIDHNIPCRILLKRAIENYIPDEAFENLPAQCAPVVRAYLSLNHEQKDYFNLKKGFDNKGQLPEKQQTLFNNITNRDNLFKDLRVGFKISGYNANHLYKLFQNDTLVNKNTLTKRCSRMPNEIEEILNEILTIL